MSNYFRRLPDFEYVSRLPDAKISDYITVKNLFKKAKLREDIFQNVSFFEKYNITGDARPDNVAAEIYDDPTLDWAILIANNIINVQTEWPLTQNEFDEYLRKKYGNGLNTEEEIYNTIYNGIHHYETIEIKNSQGVVLIPEGKEVPFDYALGWRLYDEFTETEIFITNATRPVTNYEYEEKLENEKRNIFILKPEYLGIIRDDLEDIMEYKKGATQYVSDTLKKADNIRLY